MAESDIVLFCVAPEHDCQWADSWPNDIGIIARIESQRLKKVLPYHKDEDVDVALSRLLLPGENMETIVVEPEQPGWASLYDDDREDSDFSTGMAEAIEKLYELITTSEEMLDEAAAFNLNFKLRRDHGLPFTWPVEEIPQKPKIRRSSPRKKTSPPAPVDADGELPVSAATTSPARSASARTREIRSNTGRLEGIRIEPIGKVDGQPPLTPKAPDEEFKPQTITPSGLHMAPPAPPKLNDSKPWFIPVSLGDASILENIPARKSSTGHLAFDLPGSGAPLEFPLSDIFLSPGGHGLFLKIAPGYEHPGCLLLPSIAAPHLSSSTEVRVILAPAWIGLVPAGQKPAVPTPIVTPAPSSKPGRLSMWIAVGAAGALIAALAFLMVGHGIFGDLFGAPEAPSSPVDHLRNLFG